ncbi:hypothetical protein LY632_00305 [Erythrobacter sp. SDW2]|uniref:hypothetical protein n=1 Tax=Erythrobacter sp. SDW2 TaxID=2907154 RepID=UPI001F1E8488|nr:hypothetical protein [Erythrobacter sp. SDW2]UIP06877.1 hypothetical protein LY632_00305 [Erythrobacter sp. SDW2]
MQRGDPLAIDSTGAGLSAQALVTMPADAPAGSDSARLGAALQQAFNANSVSVGKGGRYLADFAVSFRDAEGGLTTSTAVADEKSIDWQARPRDGRVFDGCKAQRMRATLVLFDQQSGAMVYRGEGEATDCSFSDEAMDEVAMALVADALGKFGG